MEKIIKILIVEDKPKFRRGFISFLSSLDKVDIVDPMFPQYVDITGSEPSFGIAGILQISVIQ